MRWSRLALVMLVGVAFSVSNGAAADMDPASLLGTWSGEWHSVASQAGQSGGRGPAEFTFTKVEGNSVAGTFRLTSETSSRRAAQFVGRDNDFEGTTTGNDVRIRGAFPIGVLNVVGQEITGKLGNNFTVNLRKK